MKRLIRAALRRLACELEWASRDCATATFGSLGAGVRIGRHCEFVEPEYITLGDYVYLGPHGFMGGRGGIRIGRNTALGPHVYIYANNHRFQDAEFVPFDGEHDCRGVVIEEHVWVGGNTVILPGAIIREGAIIGAGAVVSGEIPRCAIAAGNPARVIKYRDIAHFDRLVAAGKFYLQHEVEHNHEAPGGLAPKPDAPGMAEADGS